MLGVGSLLLLCHCIYSSMRWRKFLQGNTQPIHGLPLDIILEAVLAIALGVVAIVSHVRKLRKINVFQQIHTLDKVLERRNFRTYDDGRGRLLQDVVKRRLGVAQFALN